MYLLRHILWVNDLESQYRKDKLSISTHVSALTEKNKEGSEDLSQQVNKSARAFSYWAVRLLE